MKNKNILLRLTSILTSALMLFGVLAISPSAVDIEEEAPADFLWELDFAKMSDFSDNMGNAQYTLEGKNVTLDEAQGKKALSIINKNGTYTINDVDNIFDDYNTFYIEADMFFEAYPSGTSNEKTAMEYPMSFVSWV